MTIHELKCWPEFFEPIVSGVKTAELRYNDRNYRVGDVLILREWDPPTARTVERGGGNYTGRTCRRRVSHIVYGVGSVGAIAPLKGLNANYVMMSLREVDDVELWHSETGSARAA